MINKMPLLHCFNKFICPRKWLILCTEVCVLFWSSHRCPDPSWVLFEKISRDSQNGVYNLWNTGIMDNPGDDNVPLFYKKVNVWLTFKYCHSLLKFMSFVPHESLIRLLEQGDYTKVTITEMIHVLMSTYPSNYDNCLQDSINKWFFPNFFFRNFRNFW